jgi:hypothetical protein
VQENQGREGKLTKASGWPELPWKGEDDDDRWRRESSARGPTATGGLRGSNHPGPTQEVPAQVIKRLREPGTQRRGRIEAAEQITGGGVVAQFQRCRGLELQHTAQGASRRRGGAFAGEVVVRGAAERPVGGEAEASARRREEGGGGAAGLQRCYCG